MCNDVIELDVLKVYKQEKENLLKKHAFDFYAVNDGSMVETTKDPKVKRKKKRSS